MSPQGACVIARSEVRYAISPKPICRGPQPAALLPDENGDEDLVKTAWLRDTQPEGNVSVPLHPGFPHGTPTTHADKINADILEFLTKSEVADDVAANYEDALASTSSS